MTTNNKRTIFYSWVSSYVCISLVLVIIYTPIMFVFKDKIIRQNSDLNKYMLSELAYVFDSYIDQLHKSTLSVLHGDFIDKYENIGLNQYSAYENKNYLLNILHSNPDVENVAIYFTDDDYIVNQNGIFDANEYYNIYYEKDAESFRGWKEMLFGDNNMFLFDCAVGKKLVYKVDMSKFLVNKKKNCIVFSEINELSFQVKIQDLYNKTQNNIIVTDNITQNSISYNYDEDSQYIFFDRPGADPSLNYSLAIKKDRYFLSLSILRMMYICILFGFVISCMLAWYFARKHYKPIKKLLSNYIENTDVKNANEFEFIEMSIKDINNRLRKSERDNLMLNFLNDVYSEEDILKISEYYDMFVYEKYVVAMIIPNHEGIAMLKNNQYTQNDIRVIFINIIEELLNEKYPSVVIEINRMFCCVINLSDADNFSENIDGLKKLFKNSQEIILKYFGVEFNVAIGSIFDGYEGIGMSFGQAMAMTKLLRKSSVNKVIFYSDISQNNIEVLSFKMKILDAMKKRNIEECCNYYNLFVDKATEECASMERILLGTIEIMTAMPYVVLPANNIDKIEKYDYTKTISHCETVEALKKEIFEYIMRLSKEEANFDVGKKEVEICEFIKQNYADQDLNVNKISDVFSLHPVYLSRMFKEKIGQTPSDYITKIRMDEACKLLATTAYDVKVIAERVGYLSAQTFSRAFKKTIGLTPGNYRTKFQTIISQDENKTN